MKAAKSGRNSFGYLLDERTAARPRAGRRTKKRERSALNASYVIFLAVMCIATVYMCGYFLINWIINKFRIFFDIFFNSISFAKFN